MEPIKNYFANKFQVGFLCALSVCHIPVDFWDGEVFNLPAKNRSELAAKINPAGLDTLRREKLAELLVDKKKVYIELPETKAAQDLSVELNDEERLQRARILTQRNRNEAVLDTLKDLSGCEVTYLKGLAYRRLRKYSDARSYLREAANVCEDEFQKKALFLNARLAAMSPSETAIHVLNDFLRRYPNDAYTDDVLIWKAHALSELGYEVAAARTLNRILNHYPEGDMRNQALFERAFESARVGQLAPALRLLEHLKTPQGTYWRGRLMLYPYLTRLEMNLNLSQRAGGEKILRELAQKMPFNYYGYLAAELSDTKSTLHPPKQTLPKSQILDRDANFQIMRCLKKHQRFEEAVWVVDRLARSYRTEPERLVLAKKYIELGRPDKAHQLMRDLGLAFPVGNFSNFPWELSFPKAYADAFQKAAHREKMPVDWLMGLSREESQFDKDIISWAGAVGLCQLLPTTAHLTQDDLLDPLKNIDAAAKHLKELGENLGAPFKIIAAYNAGSAPVQRWSKQMGQDTPMDYFVEQIPYEQTRNYVKKVSSAWLTYAWLSGRLKRGIL